MAASRAGASPRDPRETSEITPVTVCRVRTQLASTAWGEPGGIAGGSCGSGTVSTSAPASSVRTLVPRKSRRSPIGLTPCFRSGSYLGFWRKSQLQGLANRHGPSAATHDQGSKESVPRGRSLGLGYRTTHQRTAQQPSIALAGEDAGRLDRAGSIGHLDRQRADHLCSVWPIGVVD